MVVKKSAADRLARLGKAEQTEAGPLLISRVGDKKSVADHGRYKISLPIHDGQIVELHGLCLDRLTGTFPKYFLGEAEKDLREDFTSTGQQNTLPKLPKHVGGDTDIMLGALYNRYLPNQVHKMLNGLAIYESLFKSVDGTRGVVLGPHKSFNTVNKNSGHVTMSAYLCFADPVAQYRKLCEVRSNIGFLGVTKEDLILILRI